MRFVDEVTIEVEGGAGGNGCVAFRREKHVPRGGPAGGDGGRGGDVILKADPGLGTLLDLRYQRHYRAKRGQHGQGHDRHGRGGDPLVVRVPCGTIVFVSGKEDPIADLTEPEQTFVAAAGGRPGRGNLHFVSSINRAPREAEPGEPGEQKQLRLELRLLAEVGIVGLPNAGKSTLISRISAAKPKVADYPFTTLVPTLGVVGLSGDRSMVVADIPGLIKGAHHGAGLGTRFLRHIQRTRVLLFLLEDRSFEEEGARALDDLALLRRELAGHDPQLLERKQLIAVNKLDLLSEARKDALQREFAAAGQAIHFVSAATGAGLAELLELTWQAVAAAKNASFSST